MSITARRRGQFAIGLLAALLVAVALFLRVYATQRDPLWLDEAYSAYAAGKGWWFLWHVVPRYETHPPFYYSLLRLWTLAFGSSLLAMRALGIACGMATLAVLALSGREIARTCGWDTPRRVQLTLWLVALAALAPPLIEMARQVRPYPVLILVYATGLLSILRLGRRAAAGQPVRGTAFALYLAMLMATLWLHTLGPLFAAALALGLAVTVVRPSLTRSDWLWLVGGHAAAALVYLPALAMALDQAPTWIRSTWLTFTLTAIHWKLAALYGAPGRIGLPATLVLLILGVAALARTREARRIAGALLIAMGLPVLAAIAISLTVSPVFILRTMTPVAAPALLLMAAGAAGLGGLLRWAGIAAAVMLLSQTIPTDIDGLGVGPQMNWYPAIRWLEARHRPGDIVLAYPNEGALPFAFAARDLRVAMPIRAIPTAVPALGVGGWNPTGSRGVVSLPRERLHAIAQEPALRAAPTLWLLRLGPWAYDKGDVFLNELSAGRVMVAKYRSRYPNQPIDIVGLRLTPLPHGGEGGARRAAVGG